MVQQGLLCQGKERFVRLVFHKAGNIACLLRIRQWYWRKVWKVLFLPAVSEVDVKQNHVNKVNDNNGYYFATRWSIPNGYITAGLLITGNGGFTVDWLKRKVFRRKRKNMSSVLAKHREPQPNSAKRLLLIILIGIAACAFVLLWDNLCRNSCIQVNIWDVNWHT